MATESRETNMMFELLCIWDENTVIFVGSFMTTTVNERPHVFERCLILRGLINGKLFVIYVFEIRPRLSRLWTAYTVNATGELKSGLSQWLKKKKNKSRPQSFKGVVKYVHEFMEVRWRRRARESMLISALRVLIKQNAAVNASAHCF